ncbi:MAG: hypothetical protein ACYTG5_05070 [Planctomycetota bacterium]|jgi:hypothetical protein
MQQLVELNTWIAQFAGVFFAIGVIVVHILFAMGVRIDANKRIRNSDRLLLVHPDAWAFLILVFGLIGVGFYWVMHESRFARMTSS